MAKTKKAAAVKDYIVCSDGSVSDEAGMVKFTGTYRAMLEWVDVKLGYGRTLDLEPGEKLSDKELADCLTCGDGMDMVQVWCVQDGRQVL